MDKYLNKIEKTDTCWNWIGSIHYNGYGEIYFPGHKVKRAHRVIYELLVGPIPQGLVIDHLCRNRKCVNPAHLEPVTSEENIRRGRPFRVLKTHCVNGHKLSGKNVGIRAAYGIKIKKKTQKFCKACKNLNMRRHRERKKQASSSHHLSLTI